MLSLFILAPLAGLILVSLPLGGELKNRAWWLGMALALLQVAAVLVYPQILAPSGPKGLPVRGQAILAPLAPFFAFHLAADNLTLVLLLAIGMVTAIVLWVARQMITDAHQRSNFASLLLVTLIGMNGTVLLRDMFSLYLFLEITAVSTFVLIASSGGKPALEGAFKYLILSAVATVLMLSAIALLVAIAGGTSFDAVRAALAASRGDVLAKLAVGAFLCGVLIKGGVMPFHAWVPDAYGAAPAPVSVLLAGITTKVSGMYALIRLVGADGLVTGVFPRSEPMNHALLFLGALSIVAAGVAALGQKDAKRMLAYSSISQLGYIVLAVGCGTKLAVAGAVFHLFNHAVFKSLLFVNAAAVEQQVGSTDMETAGGLGGRMPITGTTAVLGSLSAAGIPPFAGFWSKLVIIIALWQTQHFVYAGVAVLLSVVTLAYLLVWQRRVFFGKVAPGRAEVREAPAGLTCPALVLAGVSLGVGVLFPLIVGTFLFPLYTLLQSGPGLR